MPEPTPTRPVISSTEGGTGPPQDISRAPTRFLDELLEPLLHRAVDAARKAIIAAASAETARRAAEGNHASDFLKGRALEMSRHAVRLGLEAHALCEETIGVERAVSRGCVAIRTPTWRP